MMKAALNAAKETNKEMQILGVTVLTSFDEDSMRATGFDRTPSEQVLKLARLAEESGLSGLVCSPLEIDLLRKNLKSEMDLITPGIRPAGSDSNEQKRIMTPSLAAKTGSSYIVVGRPILKAENPAEAAKAIIKELKDAK